MKNRRIAKPETIAAILKAYLQDKVPVGELAEKYGVQPSSIYRWQNQLFSDAAQVFIRKNDRKIGKGAVERYEAEITELKAKLAKKDEVLGEVMEEYVKAKKLNGAT